jgi:hypothetical protein
LFGVDVKGLGGTKYKERQQGRKGIGGEQSRVVEIVALCDALSLSAFIICSFFRAGTSLSA